MVVDRFDKFQYYKVCKTFDVFHPYFYAFFPQVFMVGCGGKVGCIDKSKIKQSAMEKKS